jgi:hypothetical protein
MKDELKMGTPDLERYAKKCISHHRACNCREFKFRLLAAELRAYHDREWLEPHENIPAHKAGELPEDCGTCKILIQTFLIP